MKTTLIAFLLFTTFLYGQCPPGDVTITSQLELNNFIATYPNCVDITGNLLITGPVTDLSTLDNLLSIEGDLIIRETQLNTISNFDSLLLVLNSIDISENALLTQISGFNELIDLSQLFKIELNPNLESINGFNTATDIFGDFWITGNTSLQSVDGFNRLAAIYGLLGINDCPLLTSIPSFNTLILVGWAIQFYNTGLADIPGFDNLFSIGGVDPTSGFNVSNNLNLVTVSGFNCLETIAFDLLIQDNPLLDNIMGLSSLASVGQFFNIRNNASLSTLNGMQNLSSVSTTGYETTVVFEIHDNPQLSDCDPLCNLFSSNGIIGLTNITDNLSGCNSEAEINTTNCVPSQSLNCTSLIDPVNGEIDVAVDTNISWNPIAGTTSYTISIGTTSEGTQIANNLDVGNITSYDLPNDLPGDTEIFVKVKPNNVTGQAKCCDEESFTTEASPPECTTLSNPIDGAVEVSISTSISWNSVSNATGYIISVGTFSGGIDLVDNLDVGNTTSYNPVSDLLENTTIFVTITAYNTIGNSTGCSEESFITQAEPLECSRLLNPINGATNISVSTPLSWQTSLLATGYIINIGLTPIGSEVIDNLDIGNFTTYNLTSNLPFNSQIYVRISPYNSLGQSPTCQTESFTTGLEFIEIPKFFTPNNDNRNETWTIKDPLNEIEAVYIFNRYGKLLKSLYSLQNGWNGTFNNQLLPTHDYWYVIKLNTGRELKGHFTLKR